jgi:propionyl-CoA carboxylase alpha chain
MLDDIGNARKRAISGQMIGPTVRFARRRIVRIGDAEFTLEVHPSGDGAAVTAFAPQAARLSLQSDWRPGALIWHGSIDGIATTVQVRPLPNGYLLSHRGVEARAYVFTEEEAAAARLMPEKASFDAGKSVLCPMPGLIVSIAVAEGQEVKAGETLAVVEAMKMENILRAERDGTVKVILAKPGDSLPVDAVILEFA